MLDNRKKRYIGQVAENVRYELMRENVDNENLDTYLRSLNIGVSKTDMSESAIDAFVSYNVLENRPNIVVDSTQNFKRRIFSMAHELGHLILDYDYSLHGDNDEKFAKKIELRPNEKIITMNFRKEDGYSPDELESEYAANYFAAHFLVTDEEGIAFLENYAKPSDSLAELINKMADYFVVSDTTARIRLESLLKVVNL